MKGHDTAVSLHIGKSGVTEAWLNELHEQVERRRLVKVRILPSARGDLTMKELGRQMAEKAGVKLVEVRGSTAVFESASRPNRP